MNINFYLKDPKSKGETTILLSFTYKGYRLKYPTGISIPKSSWSKSKQIIYSGVNNSESLNDQLRELRNDLEKEYLNQINNGTVPTPAYLKKFLDERIKDENVEVENFYTIYDKFKEYKEQLIGELTFKKYSTLKNHLIAIEKYYKIRLTVNSFTKEFYYKFIDYFIYTEKHMNSSIKEKHLKTLNVFINWLVDNDYIRKNEFKGIKFPYTTNPADTISLSENELNTLFNLELSKNKRLEQVRDVFCIECFTGLRYSDTKKIQNHKIKGKVLEIYTQKTTDKIRVPLREEAEEILNRYFKKNLPLPVISNQKMNAYLKELSQLAGFDDEITILQISGKEKKESVKKKHELVSTHTGRRTFVTINYKRGLKPLDIMKITGHKSYATFMKYYRLDEIDVTESYFSAWEEINPKYKTKDIIQNLLKSGVDKELISRAFGIEIEKISLIN
ncbi:MAG: tyrosine-type recombinase/integrase [Bacteroidales bacterium]